MSEIEGIIIINIEKVCRICLTEQSEMFPIDSKVELENDDSPETDSSLKDLLNLFANSTVELDDGLPQFVCTICCPLLLDAYKFKLKFDQTDAILQQYRSKLNAKQSAAAAAATTTTTTTTMVNTDEDQSDVQSDADDTCETLDHPESSTNTTCASPPIIKTESSPSPQQQLLRQALVAPEKLTLHPCPICAQPFPALRLRDHVLTHQPLNQCLKIPIPRLPRPPHTIKAKPARKLKPKVVLKCEHCDATGTADFLRLHRKTHDQTDVNHKCDQCERVFKQLRHLNIHRWTHIKQYPYNCTECGKGFVIKFNYECHMLTHDPNQPLPHECPFCLKRFSNPGHLNRHKTIHTDNISYANKYRVNKCARCLQTFKERAQMSAHACTPVAPAAKRGGPYKCDVCPKLLSTLGSLYAHKRNVHRGALRKVLCTMCGKRVSCIHDHMMRHRGERRFACDECGKRFVTKQQVRRHQVVHTGVKPYVCSVCAKAFTTLYNLQAHERIHKGDRCHECAICGKGFLEKSHLKKHMNVHTKS